MATPADLEALKAIETAKAAGEDPFGDEDEDEDVTDTDTNDDGPEVTATPEGEAEPAAELEQPESAAPITYKTELAADYKEKRTALMLEKAETMKKLMDGELSAEEFATADARISDALEDMTAQRIRAETLQEANVQTQVQYQNKEIKKIIARTKEEVDYMGDAKAQRQFDMALTAVGSDPDNAGKEYGDLLEQAHKVVCALRGVQSKGAIVAAAITSRIPPAAPVTLRGMPAAASTNAGGDALENLGRLKGQAYEDAFAKLSPAQRRSMLDEA